MATLVSRLDRNPPSQGPLNVNPLKGKTFIVADDNKLQRRKIRELYESLGLVCVGEAADGLDTLVVADKVKADLISLDILMPTMHGVEALGHLRESHPRAIIVLVSALGNVESVAEVRSKGHAPDAVFSKQDSRDMFLEVLREVFREASEESDESEDTTADEGPGGSGATSAPPTSRSA